MPHVVVKLWPGNTEEEKQELTERIVQNVIETLKVEEKVVTVAFEEVSPKEWGEKVYRPEILEKEDTLYKKPGYTMEL